VFCEKAIGYYYDPLCKQTVTMPFRHGKRVQAYLADVGKLKFIVSAWRPVEGEMEYPEQQNGVDCGVFTLTMALFLLRGMSPTFDQRHMPYMRHVIMHVLLAGKETRAQISAAFKTTMTRMSWRRPVPGSRTEKLRAHHGDFLARIRAFLRCLARLEVSRLLG
jgi:hypothetical protein